MPAPPRGRGIQTAPEKGSLWGHCLVLILHPLITIIVMTRWVVFSGLYILILEAFYQTTFCFGTYCLFYDERHDCWGITVCLFSGQTVRVCFCIAL